MSAEQQSTHPLTTTTTTTTTTTNAAKEAPSVPSVYVVGTANRKGEELFYVRDLIAATGVSVVTVDISTQLEHLKQQQRGSARGEGDPTTSVTTRIADFTPEVVADYHPSGGGRVAVFGPSQPSLDEDNNSNEDGKSHPQTAATVYDREHIIDAMTQALEVFLVKHQHMRHGTVAGVIGLGGSCGTALISPAMQGLPIGSIPKIMVSTMASGNVATYVGASDITMMFSVVDIAGRLNRISRSVLANAAHQIAGAVLFRRSCAVSGSGSGSGSGDDHNAKKTMGLTMFGVTTPCVQQVTAALDAEYDCLVFHATGRGGKAMEKLADSDMLDGMMDLTTTEVADLLCGGEQACDEDRFGSIIRTGAPSVISCGALDMVNFGQFDTIPRRYTSTDSLPPMSRQDEENKGPMPSRPQRQFHRHNAQVTLMRTTPAENAAAASWIAGKLNQCDKGPLTFIIPEKGFSAMDAPGKPFWCPEADEAFITTFEAEFKQQMQQQKPQRRLLRVPYNINEPEFVAAAIQAMRDMLAVTHPDPVARS